MAPADWSTLSVMASVFSTGALTALWIESRFRKSEKLLYHEMDKHRREDDERFSDYGLRVQKLELNAFGFTKAP